MVGCPSGMAALPNLAKPSVASRLGLYSASISVQYFSTSPTIII